MASESSDILIVEDDFFVAEYLRTICEDLGYRVCDVVSSAEEAVKRASVHRPRLVLMDIRLKGEKDGIHAACEIHQQGTASVVFVTGSREHRMVRRIHEEDHPAAVLFKPIIESQLAEAVHKQMSRGGGRPAAHGERG